MNELTPKREKELVRLVHDIDAQMAPLRKMRMSTALVVLNEQRAKLLNELFRSEYQ